jgi:hypothetical protein
MLLQCFARSLMMNFVLLQDRRASQPVDSISKLSRAPLLSPLLLLLRTGNFASWKLRFKATFFRISSIAPGILLSSAISLLSGSTHT